MEKKFNKAGSKAEAEKKGNKGSKIEAGKKFTKADGSGKRGSKAGTAGNKSDNVRKATASKSTGRSGKAETTKQATKSRCPYSKKCGGCQMIDMPYKKQIAIKQEKMEELLGKFGEVSPFMAMENPDHYRCKVHAVFTHDKKGNPQSGIYKEGTHDVVPIDACLLENEKADAIIATIRGMLRSFKIKTYDEDNGYGLLRHVLIRVGHNTGEIMVVLVLTSPILPSKNNFVKALLKEHPEITTIVINVNDKHTSMILGDKEKTIYGPGFIYDTVCGMKFKISPKSFYQVNPVQTEKLYSKAVELAGLTGKETVLDCYCGVGTIGIIASPKAKEVIGVELNKDAVRDARLNARMNEIKNIDIYENDASKFMVQMAEAGEKVDVVFMDPPRAGSTEVFMESMFKLAPDRVVYVSCSPDTLARDLEFMTKNGYVVKRIIPVDMFAHTRSVETVVLLTRTTDKEF
ncbi:23S rRNA (uracil(1939)-C(5))-methyltransferase RlmD [Butyrivibrio sp. WCD3002]|uniref:23S rRNA (uracil(1939)-C(5))-methyltransferase RlmD n=1 Tax=Butyrivibrio sp. WCD3002 TaxID=1280676 RepID=UPI0004247558|nr:23S rRNA (uracil(1939)-C(5))-methyltransferase RlmD [Butyrivibrio sp. WCD3002]